MKNTQLSLDLKQKLRHGGARKGAGRPRNKNGLIRHERRERVVARTPLHITVKLRPGLWSLRSYPRLKAMAHAIRCAAKQGLKIQHFSIQSNHAHFIAEAANNKALARGMQSLAVSLARNIDEAMTGFRKGKVFLSRYHLHVLRTPNEVKNAIRYVLGNASKHERVSRIYLDRFSSAWHFKDWARAFGRETEHRLARGLKKPPPWVDRLGEFLSPARSWLLSEGWSRA